MSIAERLEAIERRLDQMNVRGVIEQVDTVANKVRVRCGPDTLTDWIKWKPVRSGQVTMWSPPQVGEGCTVLSDGDLDRGEVLLGSYHDAMPSPSTNPDEIVIMYPDGTKTVYDMKAHKLTVEVKGDVVVNATGTIKADADKIHLNGGAGVVTGNHICQISGKPHSDCSSTVTAGK